MGLHEDEDRKYAEDVQAVQNWWNDSRWRFTKRPFTAEQIVAKRGNLTINYPSGVQAKKLWGILEQNWKVWVELSLKTWGNCTNLRLPRSYRTRRLATPMAASSPP